MVLPTAQLAITLFLIWVLIDVALTIQAWYLLGRETLVFVLLVPVIVVLTSKCSINIIIDIGEWLMHKGRLINYFTLFIFFLDVRTTGCELQMSLVVGVI